MPTNKPLEKSIENVLRKAVEDAGYKVTAIR